MTSLKDRRDELEAARKAVEAQAQAKTHAQGKVRELSERLKRANAEAAQSSPNVLNSMRKFVRRLR